MQSIFRILKNKCTLLMVNIKRYFKSLNKKKTTFTLLTLVFSVFSIIVSSMIISNLSFNITQSSADIISEKIKNDKNQLGFIYSYETEKNTYELCSMQPEKSKEIRSVNRNIEIYDLYPAGLDQCSPATITYNGSDNIEISFLLLPKENYTNSYFDASYNYKMLAGGANKESDVSDLYINKKYADYLLTVNSKTKYDDLLNLEIKLPYNGKYSKNKFINYIIKGVIDETDEKYIYYKNYFGDFFLANQYLSLPISSSVCFKINSNDSNLIRENLDLLNRIYKYESAGRHYNALNFTFFYQYRFMSISTLESSGSYKNINAQSEYFAPYFKMYDYYFSKTNVVSVIVLVILLLIFVVFSIYFYVLADSIEFSYSHKNIWRLLSILIISFIISLLLSRVLTQLIFGGYCIANSSWLSFLLMIVCDLVLFISYWIVTLRNKRRKNKVD